MKESKIKIVSTRIGYSNSILLVNGSNSVIIDTGVKGNINRFKLLLKQFQLKPSDIRLIILTHTMTTRKPESACRFNGCESAGS
ncbi:MAG: MBL fold metallo-hydrolase [Draconibacterium sp.]|nr:MBL fold metallo-hydrolase [Draconibacterium sp.]